MLNRRLFLRHAALIGCSAAAHPLMTPMAFASAPGENRLVVIILRGAMDGIDAFQPYGDGNLRGLRRTLSRGPDHGALDLDGFFALHPGLSALMPLWNAGQLAFAPAVSTPYRDKRSHFDGQDMLEAGTGTDAALRDQRDGWLNRMLQVMPDMTSETAYAVGAEKMRILDGPADSLSWAPRSTLTLSPQAERLLEHVYHDDPLLHPASVQAIAIAEGLSPDLLDDANGAEHLELARFTADRLNRDTRIATFSISGWDTHAGQANTLDRSLKRLAAAIVALKDDLGRNWDTTTVMAMTEFGRTARENGSGGTDHGTGGAMLVAGGAIRGGRALGAWPGLGEGDLYDGRDLMPVRDIRAYAAWAMHQKFGIDRSRLEGAIFPGLDMGPDPRLLA
ncbi:DUF1501 domain-containing protein [Paracoccus sp. 1_MG-2023]|uniref:DUF1501 domain-containing protein n=1 Tax=unclassified Paracoccus (in: a-proteobacteria) TaxID=2688777 RepID=UPI001C0A2B5A|nr:MULTISPECIES: DUF1501 domain-containing protein [unclassified Paracoccus (in: a-proteobacteria)]MBU2958162.1 DUF1501 domain-containing protein [Paracoccus sp. C2R09]MDO6668289.1 DUF1501 domain-containing protein [Paracoccus sp. 1_MG-2023]